ncbi:MAG: hypothetical protein KTR14_04505 [Vampirovibrio sp.]|nr:hypothetical protein [Vampirovibrio sp.]
MNDQQQNNNNTGLVLEAWKQTISVQMHFNDVEMKIRGGAITLTVALLSVAGVIAKLNATAKIEIFGIETPLTHLLLYFAFSGWLLFYFMERFWYHKLLYGAVRHGKILENSLQQAIPNISLTKLIGDESPIRIRIPFIHCDIHSKQKIDLYYWGIPSYLLVILKIVLSYGLIESLIAIFLLGIIWLLPFCWMAQWENSKKDTVKAKVGTIKKFITVFYLIALAVSTFAFLNNPLKQHDMGVSENSSKENFHENISGEPTQNCNPTFIYNGTPNNQNAKKKISDTAPDSNW